ncbi:M20/M25/M40 family metallo-hydrolase [Catenulispora subtropica]|uniref:Dipeptidase n=1 Tax=Catenulispora subtropica TaxID=450798 RepID=A0ABP5DIY2_9ACTN
MDIAQLTARVDTLMPQVADDLKRLAAIPSIAFPGYPKEKIAECHDLLVGLLRDAGVQDLRDLELPDTSPIITGHIPPPTPDAPTVLLYGHYDVQPPGDEKAWTSPPFTPTEYTDPEHGPAIRGRGIADDKANLAVHLGALRAFDGRPPVGIRIILEGQEEYGSVLDDYPAQNPAAFACDAMVVADMGNIRPGTPTLTTALRGDAEVEVEVRTLKEARHSGLYGGAAPDALLTLIAALATLHDDKGDVAVAGLRREPWAGTAYTEEEFRSLATVEPDVPLLGTGGLGERLWSGPAITVVGLDAPAVDTAALAVVPYARALINLRIHPRQDPREAQQALITHLERLNPFGVELTVTPQDAGPGFAAATGGPAYQAAAEALKAAWGPDPVQAASGGAIPLVNGLAKAVPNAEILLFGAEDAACRLHGPNERVLLSELRNSVLAEAAFFQAYAAGHAKLSS